MANTMIQNAVAGGVNENAAKLTMQQYIKQMQSSHKQRRRAFSAL